MSKPIVLVGSLNADLVTRLQRFPAPGETLTAEDFQVFSGGKGANQAYAAGPFGRRRAHGGSCRQRWLR